uniref:D-isomer specific 2-hydroxyacid dehydrogenase NAD-binding domain-containing protein n=1 Tax=Aegilops tauschii subsp. strangulata TaxID=200361 RepID=A0A453LRR7_AEGTS
REQSWRSTSGTRTCSSPRRSTRRTWARTGSAAPTTWSCSSRRGSAPTTATCRRRGHGQQHRVGGGGPADAHPRPPAQLPAGAPPGRRWGAGPRRRRAPGLRPGGQDGAGRIGRLLLQRLKPFGCTLLYHDRLRVDAALEEELGAAFEEEVDAMLPKCDVVVLNMPLTDKTRGMFDKEKIAKMKRGVIIVNNARGAVMDTQAVADACRSAHRR